MIIAVMNLKGGTGKTTTAVALATAAIRSGVTARVLDADPQGSSSLWAALASEDGEGLPFDVSPANVVTLRKVSGPDGVTVIDCPPAGAVADAALEAADVVVVPTAPAAADVQQTWRTVAAVAAAGKPYAVVITQARPNTLSLAEAVGALEERDESFCDTVIPLREDIKNAFGSAFGPDLYGYDAVLGEVLDMMEGE